MASLALKQKYNFMYGPVQNVLISLVVISRKCSVVNVRQTMTEIKLAFSGCGSQKNNFDALCYNDLGFYDWW